MILGGGHVEIVEFWWKYVLHATWTSSLAAIAVVALVWLGRRWPAAFRRGLLLIILLKFAIPPMLSLPTGLFTNLGPSVSWRSETDLNAPGRSPVVAQGDAAVVGSSWGLTAKTILMGIHLLGIGLLGVLIARQAMMLSTLIRCGRHVTSGPLYDRFRAMSRRLRLRRRVRLVVSSAELPPIAVGVFRPAVVLPTSTLTDLKPSELSAVLAHELAHHRRGDLWINWVLAAVGAVWWFNPIVWLVIRHVRSEGEDCCDDLLIARGTASPTDYCTALVKMASVLPHRWRLSAALGFADTVHPIAGRIRRIMDPHTKQLARLTLGGVAVVAIFAGLVLPGLPAAEPPRHGRVAVNQNHTPPASTVPVAHMPVGTELPSETIPGDNVSNQLGVPSYLILSDEEKAYLRGRGSRAGAQGIAFVSPPQYRSARGASAAANVKAQNAQMHLSRCQEQPGLYRQQVNPTATGQWARRQQGHRLDFGSGSVAASFPNQRNGSAVALAGEVSGQADVAGPVTGFLASSQEASSEIIARGLLGRSHREPRIAAALLPREQESSVDVPTLDVSLSPVSDQLPIMAQPTPIMAQPTPFFVLPGEVPYPTVPPHWLDGVMSNSDMYAVNVANTCSWDSPVAIMDVSVFDVQLLPSSLMLTTPGYPSDSHPIPDASCLWLVLSGGVMLLPRRRA